ncbi:MAG: hypothetical protein ACRBBS_10990 [Thalassovita sp.]
MQDQSTEILATAQASAPRRWMGIGMLALLGGLLIYVAFVTPPATIGWQVFLLILGAASLYLAEKMRRATELVIQLSVNGLHDDTGAVIAALDEIAAVSRGTFAMKPSNGFTLRLNAGGARAWQPGVYWRWGRRVGIGGVLPGSQTKFMAEMLEAMLAQRG